MIRISFWIDERMIRDLEAIKDQTGVPKSEQFRRGLKLWINACRRIDSSQKVIDIKMGER
jgi:hypothetical protein